jgi:hypothetical protein
MCADEWSHALRRSVADDAVDHAFRHGDGQSWVPDGLSSLDPSWLRVLIGVPQFLFFHRSVFVIWTATSSWFFGELSNELDESVICSEKVMPCL